MIYADFDKEKCKACAYREKCAVKEFATKNKLSTSVGQIESAKIRKLRNDENYKKTSRLRSGIEGIPSVLRRKYRIDDRKTKGVVYLKIVLSSSILSINIKRITKYVKQKKVVCKLNNKFYKLKRNIYSFMNKCFFFYVNLFFFKSPISKIY